MNPVELSLFVSRMEAICEEMGSVLRRSAFSPNIKDRLDFSCALFDARGELCAQAAHIPVHLGSMAFAMGGVVSCFDWQPGQIVILNDPFLGGTHLPDVTLIAPVFAEGSLSGFAVNRAHHANIGSDTPGSMPLSTTLEEEGVIISPRLLKESGELSASCLPLLNNLNALDDEQRLTGDIAAQVSAVMLGAQRLESLVLTLGRGKFGQSLLALNNYAETLARQSLQRIPPGTYAFEDVLDDDGAGTVNILLKLVLTVADADAEFMISSDFTGSAAQVRGNVNCPLSVTAAAVYYVFRCLMPAHAPACAGLFRPIVLKAEEGSVVNARYPAAVVAGNVETSTRLVDVVMGALAKALPEEMPAASQGSMNNVAMGKNTNDSRNWDYYETLAGGHGAGPNAGGGSAMHSHMTNTLNTPVESLELHYPIQLCCYALRDGSGGAGLNNGGDGLIREYRFLAETSLSLLTERRLQTAWGLKGGAGGSPGSNTLNGKPLPGKCTVNVAGGDLLRIETPGGGGWGQKK